MSGHLCLKWNNHSTAFIKSISNIQIKERYCDATIACQGRYFPVHRVVLSTCSDYFDEIFERIDCPHPYIIFKDIEPREMELLLNYMYQGEVNVVQENLPTLIKAAEALKVKGLAVPDDLPASKDSSSSKKRSSDTQMPKRRSEEKRRRRDSSDQNSQPNNSSTTTSDRSSSKMLEHVESKIIKEEPLESTEYENPPIQTDYGEAGFSGGGDSTTAEPSQANPGEKSDTGEGIFVSFGTSEETENFIKSEDTGPTEPYNEEQSSSWGDFTSGDIMQDLPETSTQDDVCESDEETNNRNNFYNVETNLVERDDDEVTLDDADLTLGDDQLALNVCPTISIITDVGIIKKMQGKKKFLCPHCDYESTKMHNMRRHIRSKHMDEKPFNCDLCSKRFRDNSELRAHLRIHTGEKPFECHICHKRFTRNYEVTRHTKFAHLPGPLQAN